jgi:glycosyltransferase involved in cell wall biosynthesis
MSVRKCDLSLILACYNEAGHLEESVRQITRVLDSTRWSYEIIFVDDCSADETCSIIDKIMKEYRSADMTKVVHARNTGRGKTVCDGFRRAKGDIVGYIDVDLEVHARYIPSCVRAIHEGADAAYAQRTYKLQPSLFHRHILSRGYSELVQSALDIQLSDTESGFKFFRRDKLLPLLEQATDPGWFWDTQIMAYWVLAGHSVAEIPALFIRREDKRSSVRVWRDSADYFVKLWEFGKVVRAIRSGESSRAADGAVAVPVIYDVPPLYQLAMRVLYGSHLRGRYEAISAEIPSGSRVVDVCMGDGALYLRCLRSKSVSYIGLDRSPAMVHWARQRGIDARQFDITRSRLPNCDIAVIQASLYQFLPDARPVVEKLLQAAREKVIVSEPVVNLSASRNPWVAALSRRLTNPDPSHPSSGDRFDETRLDQFFRSFRTFERSFPIAGGRECVGIFRGQSRA